MPATRVTVVLNARQLQKTPLLVPASTSADPADTSSIRALVFKTTQSKLRLNKPEHVFVGGTGQELLTKEDWEENIKNDVMLLVSAGEEYVGVKKAPNVQGIVHAVGQPDLHQGTRFPIGAVFASKKWIHPPLIGSDIGCGMAWYKTTLSRKSVDGFKGKKVAEKLRGLEGAWHTQADRKLWLQDEQGSCSAGKEWDSALGTIGAGNHFAEIQVVEDSLLGDGDITGLHQNDVVLLVHSGSRGYGGSILRKYTTESHSSFEEDSPEAVEYIKEHDKACRWAKANRDLIAVRFLACLEPGQDAWELGRSDGNDLDVVDVESTKQVLQQRRIVDIWHNNVERVLWPPSPPPRFPQDDTTSPSALAEVTSNPSLSNDTPEQDYVYMHRKGAAPTYNPSTQLPLTILPLPGSRGTPTLILQPTFSARTSWGLKNALSLAHGAGRAMSRTKARSTLAQKYKDQNILEPRSSDIEGTWVICDEKDLVWEEAPEAYKDVEAVGQDLVDAGVARVVGRCRVRISYKVRIEGR